jgi:hypothetical protein
MELAIPKLRKGSYFPSILERRNMMEEALLTVVQEAYVQGISTRKMQKLFKSFGLPGIDTPALVGRRQGKQGLPALQRTERDGATVSRPDTTKLLPLHLAGCDRIEG